MRVCILLPADGNDILWEVLREWKDSKFTFLSSSLLQLDACHQHELIILDSLPYLWYLLAPFCSELWINWRFIIRCSKSVPRSQSKTIYSSATRPSPNAWCSSDWKTTRLGRQWRPRRNRWMTWSSAETTTYPPSSWRKIHLRNLRTKRQNSGASG